jgi:hypothetical protein
MMKRLVNMLAFGALMALWAGSAQAVVVFYNMDRIAYDVVAASGNIWGAQQFKTDEQAYVLNSVTLLMSENTPGGARVDIYSGDDVPTTYVGTLTSPGSYPAAAAPTLFAASGVPLAANTTYWVVLHAQGSGSYDWVYTDDPTGSGAGFSPIWADSEDGGVTWPDSDPDYPYVMQVDATATGTATVPQAPTAVSATAGNAQATVNFSAPANDGGSPVRVYTATSTPGNLTGSCTVRCSSINVTGLTNNVAYTFKVTATNAIGTGPASAPSNSVTPAPSTATYALTVTKAGTGSGTISGMGIECGNDCTETYANGTVVILTAHPGAGSSFAGWSGACANASGSCTVSMIAARSVMATFSGAAANHQGLWWIPSESGWGINFAHQGDVIFATWFTYDATGKPWWLIALLDKTANGVYSGPVSTVTGPLFNSVPFGPTPVETEVGTMTATFADTKHATLAYTVNGVSQTKAIVPQEFGNLSTCVWGAQPNLALATNYQDLWWNANESGWGINFTHQGDIIFATWFTYDAQGKPWWLIVLLDKTADGVYSGPVSTVTGPPFDSVPWSQSPVAESEVGTATVTFADGNAATFAYTVNGTSRSKAITRQVFTPPGTVCQ